MQAAHPLVLVLVALGLAGCTSSPANRPSDTSSSTTTTAIGVSMDAWVVAFDDQAAAYNLAGEHRAQPVRERCAEAAGRYESSRSTLKAGPPDSVLKAATAPLVRALDAYYKTCAEVENPEQSEQLADRAADVTAAATAIYERFRQLGIPIH
jgi:hypothetical protein